MTSHPSRTVNLYHQGKLISSQPWVWDEEASDYVPSDELYCFSPEWNEAITPDTADVWDELHGWTITSVQDDIMFGRKTGSCAVESISDQVVITYTID